MSKTKTEEFYTSICPPLHAVIMLMLILHTSMTTLEASHYACDVSRSTMQIVMNCPDSEEKWREAAARKNCAAYANMCRDPESLVYHCLLNEYINETLEVCAYAQNIVFGHCTYYSGNRILPNFRTSCMDFVKNPCPLVYRSTEAYKYQGCYELTKTREKNPEKNLEIFLETKEVEKSVPVTAATSVSTVDGNGKEDVAYTYFMTLLIPLIIVNLIFGICLLYFCRLLVKYYRLKSYGSG